MRISDDRCANERLRQDLPSGLLCPEARTQSIRVWTGLTDGRIRKLLGVINRSGIGIIALGILAGVCLTACGGGADASSLSAPPGNASISYPATPLVFAVGTSITTVTPTVTGSFSNFTVAPALPTGLNLDPMTGSLSGKPAAVTAAARYTVSASGSSGNASASVSITVNDVVPSALSYGTPAVSYTTNVAARTLMPSASGGAAVSWSIDPPLPAGLNFSTSDGSISGTPTAAAAANTYVITALNSGGQATVSLKVEVDADVLLDLGHTSSIDTLRFNGSRVLSAAPINGSDEHWVLWDYASASAVASGDVYGVCAVVGAPGSPACWPFGGDMAGATVVLRSQNGFEVRSSSTGQLLSNITASVSWWGLAADGSYISAGSSSGLFAWSPSGQLLLSRSGDYSRAIAFAAPGQIRIAAGPAGQSVIETVTVMGGQRTISGTFNGQFAAWFLDGSKFISAAGNTLLVYSSDVVQQAAMPVLSSANTPVVGQGNWVWTVSAGTLSVFAIASSATPVATYIVGVGASEIPSGTTIALITQGLTTTGFSVIDLSGATPSKQDYSPSVLVEPGAAYAASSASQWMVGNSWGVLLDGASLGVTGTPRYFGYGAAWSLAGSSGHIAVATASGRILYFNTTTLTQEGTIGIAASKVSLSSDGSVLAAAGDELDGQYHDDWSLGIYSLPTASLLHSWPYSFASRVRLQDFALSGSGDVLGQVIWTTTGISSYTQQANPTTGGSAIFSSSFDSPVLPFPPPIRISPDGTLIATSSSLVTSGANPGTDMLKNGSLVTAVSGRPIGWIDNGHLLVDTYNIGPGNATEYAGCILYDGTGTSAGACGLPAMSAFLPVSADSIYSVDLASILSVSTGSVLWTSGDEVDGSNAAVAGGRVVFVSGNRVVAQGH